MAVVAFGSQQHCQLCAKMRANVPLHPRYFEGSFPRCSSSLGLNRHPYGLSKYNCTEYLYAVVVKCVKITDRLQFRKSRKKIPIFSCALINEVKAKTRIFEGHRGFGCLVKVIASSDCLSSEGLPADHSGLKASHIFDPCSQEDLEDIGWCSLHLPRAPCPLCHAASPATAPPPCKVLGEVGTKTMPKTKSRTRRPQTVSEEGFLRGDHLANPLCRRGIRVPAQCSPGRNHLSHCRPLGRQGAGRASYGEEDVVRRRDPHRSNEDGMMQLAASQKTVRTHYEPY